MGQPKIRLVFIEDKNGKALSYFHLERSEGLRVVEILKLLPEIENWTPASVIAQIINARLPATLWTLGKLAGALKVDIKLSDERQVLAQAPILYLRKEQFNTRNNLINRKYLRPSVYVKGHFRKQGATINM